MIRSYTTQWDIALHLAFDARDPSFETAAQCGAEGFEALRKTMGAVQRQTAHPARKGASGCNRDPAAHRKPMQIRHWVAERVEDGDEVLGAFVIGVGAGIMGLAACAMPAGVDHDNLSAALYDPLDIAFLAPAGSVCGKAMQQDDRRSRTLGLEGNYRAVVGGGKSMKHAEKPSRRPSNEDSITRAESVEAAE